MAEEDYEEHFTGLLVKCNVFGCSAVLMEVSVVRQRRKKVVTRDILSSFRG